MYDPTTSTPDPPAVPGRTVLAAASLAPLALVFAHLLTAPAVLAVVAGLAAVAALPFVGTAVAVRVGAALVSAGDARTDDGAVDAERVRTPGRSTSTRRTDADA